MFATIAFLAIFSSIIIFFADELSAYVKAIVAKTYMFLCFSLFLASTFVILFDRLFLWLIVTLWIGLLTVLRWIMQHLWSHHSAIWVAKWLLLVIFSTFPIGIMRLTIKIRKINKKDANIYMYRSYVIGCVLGLSVLLLYAMNIS